MNKALAKVVFSELVRIVTYPIRILPVKKNRILFTGLTGGHAYDYSCNPKYLYEYMREHFSGEFEYVWAVSDKKKYAFLQEEGVKLVKHFSISSFPMLLTAGVIITNGSYAPWFPFRRQQYVVNTWHGGGAYKKVENERPDADWATRKRAEFSAANIDLFLASCKEQEKQMIRTTYRYNGEVLRAGTPRNDRIVRGEVDDMAERVRKRYGIPDTGKIVLYAPTYRRTSIPVVMDSDYLLDVLNRVKASGEEQWYFMCRYHRYQDDSMDIRVTGNHIIDVMDYPDMQELLGAADMLITDYSSCVWDYAFLRRPCFLFVPDKDEYTRNTGFYVGLEQWPFAKAASMGELEKRIRAYDKTEADMRIAEHLEHLGSYESGECCRVVVGKICEERGKRDNE